MSKYNIIRSLIVLVPLILVFGAELTVSVTLSTVIPLWLYCCSALCGAAYANIVLGYLPTEAKTPKRWFGIVSLFLILSIGLFPYLLRQCVLLGAFAFYDPATKIESFVIDGAGGRKGPSQIYVEPIDYQGRRMSIFATPDLEARYRHVSTRGIDCVMLTVQTGRWKIKRIKTISGFEMMVDGPQLTTRDVIEGCVRDGASFD